MKKIQNIFIKIVVITSLLFFGIILYDSLFQTEHGIYVTKILKHPYIIYWITSIVMIYAFSLINKYIDKSDCKKRLIIKILTIAFILIGQIIMIQNFHPVQITDPFLVNDQAVSIADGIEDKVTDNFYFKKYSNNNGDLVLSIYLTKIFKTTNIDYITGFTIFNTLMIDLGILFTYLIGKKAKDDKLGTKLLVLSAFNPLNYLFIHWTYTATYALPFMTLLVFLALLLKDSKNIWYKGIYSILFSLCLVTGYFIRPTIVIPFIAIITCYALLLLTKKTNLKKDIIAIALILTSSILVYTSISNFNKKYVDNAKDTYPITHWIMMGLHGNGTVTSKDNSFTDSFPTQKAKKEATVNEIKSTLKEYRLSGLIYHTVIKLPIAWSDGVSGYSFRMQQDQTQSKLYNWIVQDKKDIVTIYCQSFRIMTLALCLLALIKTKDDNELDFKFMNTLIVFGGITFYLIWETKNAYSYPFLPFLLIMATTGINFFDNKIQTKITTKQLKYIFIVIVTITILLGLSLYKSFVIDSYEIKDYSIMTTNKDSTKYIENVNKDNLVIKQEFTPKYKFNFITFKVKELNKNTDINYIVTLYNSNDKVIESTNINNENIEKDYITIKMNNTIEKNQKYILEIKPSKQNSSHTDSMNFAYVEYRAIENYKGEMLVNNNHYNGKLFIKIYEQKTLRYICGKAYAFILLIITLSEITIYYYTKKTYSI